MTMGRIAAFAAGALVLAIGAAFVSGSAASLTVPASSGGEYSVAVTANDMKPVECAALTLTAKVSGTGAINGTAASELIVGSSAADVITGNGGTDCILGGNGADDLRAGNGAGTGGGNSVLDAGAGADTCRAEGGQPTYVSCEQLAVAMLGGWVAGLTHAATAGQNRSLIFVALNETNPVRTLTAVTWGTRPMTFVAGASSAGAPAVRAEIWILNDAGIVAASSTTFVPTWSAAPTQVLYSSAFFSDTKQAAQIGATATAIGNNAGALAIATAALATTWGDLVVYGVGAGNAITFTAQNGFTEGTDAQAGATTTLETGWKTTILASETPSSLTSAGPGRWAIAGAVIKSFTTP